MDKILITQQKMIGDVLTSTLLFEHLKLQFPKAILYYLINEHTLPVVQGNSFIDHIIIFKKKYKNNPTDYLQFLLSIRKEKFDIVVDIYCKLESNLITLFSKAPLKISYHKWYSKYLYTHVFKNVTNKNTTVGLAVKNRLVLLSPIIKQLEKPTAYPKIFLTDIEIVAAKNNLRKYECAIGKKKLMLGLFGSTANKTYPLRYLATLVNFVCKDYQPFSLTICQTNRNK